MSRSGTTLLATIFDSHPHVSMGYELLPTGLPKCAEAAEMLRDAIRQGGDGKGAAKVLRESGQASLAQFARRCERTMVPPSELAEIFENLDAEGVREVSDLTVRARLSREVVERKRANEGTAVSGFKVNSPDVGTVAAQFENAGFLFITRDPRDVVASHIERGFDRTVAQICKAWAGYLSRFTEFAEHHERSAVVRYEDLVRNPRPTLENACAAVGLEFAQEIERFFESKASVHVTGHANAELLRRDFFTTSIGRWARGLTREQVDEVQDACGPTIVDRGYRLAATADPVPAPEGLFASKGQAFLAKRRFYFQDYAEMVHAAAAGAIVLTWREAAQGVAAGSEILLVRHDIDHDIENAVRIAQWEHEHGYRATYCVLHTAWYYGERSGREASRYREMVDACLEIQDLGHEISLHNAVPVVALREGLNAYDLLAEELGFLRLQGLDITGSASHGDALNRELAFTNHELFSETVHEPGRGRSSRMYGGGGRRTVSHNGNSIELGAISMTEFGLDYEGYDIPRDLYITDSGGRLRSRLNTFGRGRRRRHEMETPPPYPHITAILAHPIWWNLDDDRPADSGFPTFEQLRGTWPPKEMRAEADPTVEPRPS
jgi:hypothetical protein